MALLRLEAGDIVQGIRDGLWTESHIAAELGEVVLRRAPGRGTAGDIVVFKSLGLAVEDMAAAQLVCARAQGRGRQISL
jgi:ornithine cyclodeaminase